VNPLYAEVARRAGHRYEYCRAPEAVFNLPFEVEHIVPASRMGSNEAWNRGLACRSCNLYKSDRVQAIDEATGEAVALFHPRRDIWEEHFRFERESGILSGLTPCGRVTIALLRLNQPAHVVARRQ
jgi:HNH endonuclease